MVLSKMTNVMFQLTSSYLEQLFTSPVKTKAISSCIINSLGNLLAQKISGAKTINRESLLAFAMFGLIIGGPVPHYFHSLVHPFVKNPLMVLLIERCLYTPCFQVLTLYMLAVFEGNTHNDACIRVKKLYLPVLLANMKYLTLLQYLNLNYVSPMIRDLVVNMISFFWIVYLALQWSKEAKSKQAQK
ncbi:PREDICTED: peroxisomal membrane protein 2 [Dufourea novaeangliae]|uniref:Peroxisomal membrane protein 2 n=1 Tax=Dufourea novaeangliae TaxID=178035 RepID=A0A154PN13_DUFNO|nr:PREDICTED: peroxisomal membrane protein 2 [Dufourea novaeangliae]KZC13271.1 Peroxisomal membrane protein 2 [Dufourea novaeangliae]